MKEEGHECRASGAAGVLSFFGVIHSFAFVGNETIQVYGWNVGGRFEFGYLCFTAVFMLFYVWQRRQKKRGLPEELMAE